MNKLQELRRAAGLSQSQLAEKSGVPVRTLQKYETGEVDLGKASAYTVMKLAAAVGCSVEEMLHG